MIELGHTAHTGGAHETLAVQVYIIYCIALQLVYFALQKQDDYSKRVSDDAGVGRMSTQT